MLLRFLSFLSRRAVRFCKDILRTDLRSTVFRRPQPIVIVATVVPAYITLQRMWLFWPLKWCFGAKRQADKAEGDNGTVVIVVDTRTNAENDLRQQLRANDSLNQHYEARFPEEGEPEVPQPNFEGADEGPRELAGFDEAPFPTPPNLNVPTPVIGQRRPRRSTPHSTSPSTGAKTAGRKRSNPDTGTRPMPYARALTVQIPSGASPASDARSTPHSRPTPSPLPLLTPAVPTPPKATFIDSRGTRPEETPTSTVVGDSEKQGGTDVGTSSKISSVSWGAWGEWDLRSPSSDVPRTPVPHLSSGASPMALGAPAEEQVLRRRNTPFDLRVDRELRKAGHPHRKSKSPDKWKAKGNSGPGKPRTQKENVAAAYATPEANQKSADPNKSLLQPAGSGSSTGAFPEFLLTPAVSSGGCIHTPNIVGINNPPSQFREDKRLRVHETPFETRVESFMQQEDSYKRRLSLARVPAT
eukprot:jgi/Botrbrau1/13434/Bobra.0082s0038.1